MSRLGRDYPPCQIIDSKFCNICGKSREIGYPLTNDEDEEEFMFWVCEDHATPELEDDLKEVENIENIIKKVE